MGSRKAAISIQLSAISKGALQGHRIAIIGTLSPGGREFRVRGYWFTLTLASPVEGEGTLGLAMTGECNGIATGLTPFAMTGERHGIGTAPGVGTTKQPGCLRCGCIRFVRVVFLWRLVLGNGCEQVWGLTLTLVSDCFGVSTQSDLSRQGRGELERSCSLRSRGRGDSFWAARVFPTTRMPVFRVWGGYREPIQLVKHRRFVLSGLCFSGRFTGPFSVCGVVTGSPLSC